MCPVLSCPDVFLCKRNLLLSVTLAGYSSTYFWYTDMLRSLFAKQLDVTNMGLFWQFAENDLLDGLYWETWYNKGYKKADVLCPDGLRATHPCKVQSINDVRTDRSEGGRPKPPCSMRGCVVLCLCRSESQERTMGEGGSKIWKLC